MGTVVLTNLQTFPFVSQCKIEIQKRLQWIPQQHSLGYVVLFRCSYLVTAEQCTNICTEPFGSSCSSSPVFFM